MPFYTSQAASVCAHSDALRSHVAFCLDTTSKYWTSIGFPTSGHMLMQHARMISGARHRRYVRTYVCALVAAVQEIAHIEHTGYKMQLRIQYTYVRSGPNRAGGFNKKCSPAQLFRDVIFSVIHGHVEVQSKDYNLVSKMDVRLQWLKACVLISRYMVEYAKKFPSGHTKGSQPFTGRKEKAVSPLIKGSSIRALDQDCRSAKELEDGLKAIIAHYPVNAGLDKVIRARAKLFQEFGSLAILVGSTTEGTMIKLYLIHI